MIPFIVNQSELSANCIGKTMKITKKHLEYMKSKIDPVLKKYPTVVKDYESGQFPRSDKVKDLQKRFCFDLAFAANLNKFFCDVIYEYANSDHIYTALKSICPVVVRKY